MKMSSTTWDCECGNKNNTSRIRCSACGKSLKLDENLTGFSLPEPPVAEWANELAVKRTPSQESLEEVKQEYENRKIPKTKIKKATRLKKAKLRKHRRFTKRQAGYLIFPALVVVAILVMNLFNYTYKFDLNFNETQNQFKFSDIAENQVPYYFKGCDAITYSVRQNYASDRDLELITYALKVISDSYGREFVFDGTTEEFEVEDTKSQILLNFTSVDESQDLNEASLREGFEPGGLAVPRAQVKVNKPAFNSFASTKGMIWIERNAWDRATEYNKVNLVMHEIGHVLGLDHPKKMDGQVMGYGDLESVELGSGDVLGLQALSALAGCREMPVFD
jgi:hypothetical protein